MREDLMHQAFPDEGNFGISIRDYFAAKAMQGAIAGMATRAETLIYLECAALSYEMADAMLKAREA
jgi:hypothetical protein